MNKQNETCEVAIQVTGVKKKYKLGQIGGASLREELESWWAKKRGKPDPNAPLLMDERLVGKTFMALNGVDLTIHKGEAVGIIGGNGAGKSTLLKLFCRVTAPTEGEIDIYGRITSMLEVGTGFNGEMTGRENIYMNGAILGMTKQEIDEKMEDIIEFSEVKDFIDTPVKRYSSGMFVKLGFAVASHLDSEIMIMDEVLAVGDVAFQTKCLNRMKEAARKEGRTILYVSHNMSTIRTLCDRCIVLDKGKVVFQGDVEQAIAIYSHQKREETTIMDFADYVRDDYLTQKLCLNRVEFMDKNEAVFCDDEKMVLRFTCTGIYDIENVGLSVEIWTADELAQGTYAMYDLFSIKKDQKIEITVELNISMLAQDQYRMNYTFFERDIVGRNIDIENVRGFWFRKKMSPSGITDDWVPKYWGHVILPQPTRIKICTVG